MPVVDGPLLTLFVGFQRFRRLYGRVDITLFRHMMLCQDLMSLRYPFFFAGFSAAAPAAAVHALQIGLLCMRKFRRRETARRAFHSADNDMSLRRAALRRDRPHRGAYMNLDGMEGCCQSGFMDRTSQGHPARWKQCRFLQ